MNFDVNELIKSVDVKKVILDSKRPFNSEQVARIKRVFDVDMTYNSNAIEGSTMTFNETKLVLNEGLTIGGKRISEHLEIINHKHAIDFIEELSCKSVTDLRDIKDIHNLVLRGIDEQYAGKFRDKPVGVMQSTGKIHNFVDPLLIRDEMECFITNLNLNKSHPIIKAATAHYEFVTIHPFIDGNGRTARLLMNLILLQNGYPPAVIRVANRANYIQSLESAQINDNLNDFYTLVINSVSESIDNYLIMLEQEVI